MVHLSGQTKTWCYPFSFAEPALMRLLRKSVERGRMKFGRNWDSSLYGRHEASGTEPPPKNEEAKKKKISRHHKQPGC